MREEVETNLKYVDILNEWDPFQLSSESYETEIADVIQAVHIMDDPTKLAKQIQAIYEFSFEKLIPLEGCYHVALQLLKIKADQSCSI
ncbi:DUF1871 family protein [Neobacillus dielmonensis]|uniref:DUF1871 family protein n=1 Tax=Neobacillus dielmonensis TaxID=1347369 RepID=UPI0005AA769B|nr:DUF1871 family protein [Neobacillus dielmonensis]